MLQALRIYYLPEAQESGWLHLGKKRYMWHLVHLVRTQSWWFGCFSWDQIQNSQKVLSTIVADIVLNLLLCLKTWIINSKAHHRSIFSTVCNNKVAKEMSSTIALEKMIPSSGATVELWPLHWFRMKWCISRSLSCYPIFSGLISWELWMSPMDLTAESLDTYQDVLTRVPWWRMSWFDQLNCKSCVTDGIGGQPTSSVISTSGLG